MKGFIAINVLILIAIGFLWAAIRGFKKSSAWMMDVRLPNKRHSSEIDFIDKKEKIGFRLKYLERLEKKYLQETGISGRFPFVQLPTIFLLSGISGLMLSKWVWSLFRIEGLVISGMVVGLSIPFHLIALYGAWRNRKLISGLPGFYSVLQRWAQIHEDIYYCLGQLETSGVERRLSQPFAVFMLESTAGVSERDAFRHLEQNFKGTPVLHFVKCLEHMTEQRGDLVKLLQGFENESYQLQTEMSQRQDTQIKYRLLINGLSMAAFGLIYLLLNTNRILSDFYVDTLMGKALLSLLALMMAISFLGGLKYEHR